MQHNNAVLVYRFAVILACLITWGFMVFEKSTSEALQSVLTMLLGAAAGYHAQPLVHSPGGQPEKENDNA